MAMPRIILIMLVVNTLLAVAGIGTSAFLYLNMQDLAQVASAEGEKAKNKKAPAKERAEYLFHSVDKVIVSLPGEEREHYVVFDLVLQADVKTDKKKLEQVDPMVRNSALAHLSAQSFQALRAQPIDQLQAALEKAVLDEFENRSVVVPFSHVLISKMVVQ
jgi:flagellar protein FliL